MFAKIARSLRRKPKGFKADPGSVDQAGPAAPPSLDVQKGSKKMGKDRCTYFIPGAPLKTLCKTCGLDQPSHRTDSQLAEARVFVRNPMEHLFGLSLAAEAEAKEKESATSGSVRVDVKQIRSQFVATQNSAEDEKEYDGESKRRMSKKASSEADEQQEKEHDDMLRARELEREKAEEEAKRKEEAAKAEEKRRGEEARRAEEAEKRKHEEAVSARVRKGMLRQIAEGRTQQDRMHLSHTASRGEWVSEASHFPGNQSLWVGCGCQRRDYDCWCLTYKGGYGLEDQESADAHLKTEAALNAEIKSRIDAGMPEVIAKGRSLQHRKWLSHTRNDCPGVSKCGKRGAKCLGQHVKSPDNNTEYWNCCRSGQNLWCTNYEGPKL